MQQQDRDPVERSTDDARVRSELVNDLAVAFVALAHQVVLSASSATATIGAGSTSSSMVVRLRYRGESPCRRSSTAERDRRGGSDVQRVDAVDHWYAHVKIGARHRGIAEAGALGPEQPGDSIGAYLVDRHVAGGCQCRHRE